MSNVMHARCMDGATALAIGYEAAEEGRRRALSMRPP